MNCSRKWLATVCAMGVGIASAARGAEPALAALTNQLVGAWADFGRVEFTGLKTFKARQLRSALLRDVPFLLASHPQALRARFLPTLETRLTDGFQNVGFPEARVRATLDEPARRVRVRITEGPRYLSGDVIIAGATTVPVTNLVRRLTEEWAPTGLPAEAKNSGPGTYLNSAGEKVDVEYPLWEPGKPAPFDAASLEFVTRRLTNALAEAGCFFPTVKPRVVIRPGTNLADLHIDLDEGGRGRLGRIQVLGLKRNSADTVLKWLDLAPGQSMTNNLVGRLERRLWYPGRFLTYRIVPTPDPGGRDIVDLDLWLEELPEAPLLGRNFSREEQVMLKFRDWLQNAPALGDDVIASMDWGKSVGETEFVLSGQGAVAIHRHDGSLRYAVTSVGHGRATFLSFPRQRKLELGSDNHPLWLYLTVLPKEKSESGDRFNIQLGAGMSTRGGRPRSTPLEISLALAPVAFLNLAHSTNRTVTIEGNALVLKEGELTMKIDATSGRLLEILGTNDEYGISLRVRIERGAFDRLGKELASASAGFSDTFGTNQPLSFRLSVFAAELFHFQWLPTNSPPTSTAQRFRASAAMEKVSTRALAFLDPLLDAADLGTNDFYIPNVPLRLGQSAQLTGMASMAAWIFEYADQFLPARSWPWTLARESVFTLGGQGQHTEAELKGIFTSDDSGPLAFLSTALLLNKISSPAAQPFAARGLERLSPADFHKDCRLVLDPQTSLGRLFHDAARAMRDLPEDDVEALAAVLPRRNAVFLRLVITRLKATPAQPLADTLEPLLEEFWKSDLRQLVETSLRAIAREADATSERQQHYDAGLKADELKLYPDAVRSFRQAAELGLPAAQYVLAQFLEKGRGTPRDEAAAARWYHLAASNGVAEAQMLLGARYSVGLDGPDDAMEAYYWYSLAARKGDRAAEAFRNSARRKLTPAQLTETERRLGPLKESERKPNP